MTPEDRALLRQRLLGEYATDENAIPDALESSLDAEQQALEDTKALVQEELAREPSEVETSIAPELSYMGGVVGEGLQKGALQASDAVSQSAFSQAPKVGQAVLPVVEGMSEIAKTPLSVRDRVLKRQEADQAQKLKLAQEEIEANRRLGGAQLQDLKTRLKLANEVAPEQARFTRLESKSVTLDDGSSRVLNYNPATGQYTVPGTGEDVSARVRGQAYSQRTIRDEQGRLWGYDPTSGTRYQIGGQERAAGYSEQTAPSRFAPEDRKRYDKIVKDATQSAGPIRESISGLTRAESLVETGEAFPMQIAQFFVAKSAQGAGVLSNQDIERLTPDGSPLQAFDRLVKKFTTGEANERDQELMRRVIGQLKALDVRRLQSLNQRTQEILESEGYATQPALLSVQTQLGQDYLSLPSEYIPETPLPLTPEGSAIEWAKDKLGLESGVSTKRVDQSAVNRVLKGAGLNTADDSSGFVLMDFNVKGQGVQRRKVPVDRVEEFKAKGGKVVQGGQ